MSDIQPRDPAGRYAEIPGRGGAAASIPTQAHEPRKVRLPHSVTGWTVGPEQTIRGVPAQPVFERIPHIFDGIWMSGTVEWRSVDDGRTLHRPSVGRVAMLEGEPQLLPMDAEPLRPEDDLVDVRGLPPEAVETPSGAEVRAQIEQNIRRDRISDLIEWGFPVEEFEAAGGTREELAEIAMDVVRAEVRESLELD